MPSASSPRASLSAPCLVRVKTSTCRQSWWPISHDNSSRLRSRSTGCTRWRIASTVELRGSTWIVRGRSSSRSASALISSENVAENSRFCRFFGSSASTRFTSGNEAHVEHAIGFVEHEDLDAREVDVALAVMVEQAARCRDEDIDAALELRGLRSERDAAEQHHRGDLEMLAVDADRRLDLRRELARRREDQRAQRFACAALVGRRRGRQPLQDRQDESRGLAGAGLRAGQQVAAREYGGNGLRLDRRGFGIAFVGDRAHQRVGQPECRE